MLSSNPARYTYVILLLVALLGLSGLGLVVLRQAVAAGPAQAWMMAGILAVVLGLPLSMLMLAVAGWMRRHARHVGIVPNAGENVPGVGQ
ncbi:hypothetical protein [Lysobacter fragariae]